MKPSQMNNDSLMFIYLMNEQKIKQLYAVQNEIREELGRRLEPMKDRIRRGEIDIQIEGGGEDEYIREAPSL
jgi:hypothetical protein